LVPEKGEKHPKADRPKGAKNVMTRVLKDAILRAAAEASTPMVVAFPAI
jgi:hypothetical protein